MAVLAEASAGRCSCGSISYLSEYKEAFGVLLCSSCKRNETLIAKVRLDGKRSRLQKTQVFLSATKGGVDSRARAHTHTHTGREKERVIEGSNDTKEEGMKAVFLNHSFFFSFRFHRERLRTNIS